MAINGRVSFDKSELLAIGSAGAGGASSKLSTSEISLSECIRVMYSYCMVIKQHNLVRRCTNC